MPAAFAASVGKAKTGGAKVCGERRNILRTNEQVMRKAQSLFPVKTALHLVEITGYSQRAVEYWLTGEARLPADALASLLHSEWGREFLAAVMDNARPAWWMRALAYFGLADAAELQAKARRKLKAVMNADRHLEADHEQGQAAALHQDAEFFGAHFDARRAASGAAHRALAGGKKGR